MDAALEEAVGEKGERVGNVDRDAAGVRLDPFPRLLGRADLQRGHGLAEQERHGSKVGVAFYPDAAELLVHRWLPVVVFHVAQMAVGLLVIAMAFQKVGFGKLEDDGE